MPKKNMFDLTDKDEKNATKKILENKNKENNISAMHKLGGFCSIDDIRYVRFG